MKHETKDQARLQARLFDLLDEWRPEAEPMAGFDERLRRRIAAMEAARPRGWHAELQGWWLALRHDVLGWRLQPVGGLAALALLVLVTGLWWRGAPNPSAPEATVATATLAPTADPVVRDLQVMDHYGDLLNNLDFLSQSGN